MDDAWVLMGIDCLKMTFVFPAGIRAHCADVIATATQNNPRVQQVAMQGGGLAYATHMFVNDMDADVRVTLIPIPHAHHSKGL